jgi:hypothetical protein
MVASLSLIVRDYERRALASRLEASERVFLPRTRVRATKAIIEAKSRKHRSLDSSRIGQ